MSTAHDILELLYFFSGVVTATAALFALKQISLFKADSRARNERAAKEKAIEYSQIYLDKYTSLIKVYTDLLIQKKLDFYRGPVLDFKITSFISSFPENLLKISRDRYHLYEWLPALNQLQAISSAFVAGVADESEGFKIIGRTFCGTVEANYDIIALSRSKDTDNFYQSIVDLYHVWSPRLSKAELEEMRKRIDSRITSHQEKSIPPIGI